MSPDSSGSTELDDAKWPGDDDWPGGATDARDDWPGGDAAGERDPGWPDDWPGGGGPAGERDPGWPDDWAGGGGPAGERDPGWPDDWPAGAPVDGGARGVPPWRRARPPVAYGQDGGRGLRPLALVTVAVVALAAGAGLALAITRGPGNSPSPSTAPGSQPSLAAPGGNSGGGPVPGGAVGQAFVAGPVQKVSSTSITIGGPGRSMTAAITSATRVTGKVTSIGAVRAGDDVSAQITVSSSGQATVTAIQDPAQPPSPGGSLP